MEEKNTENLNNTKEENQIDNTKQIRIRGIIQNK